MPGTQPVDPEADKTRERELCKAGEHASAKTQVAYLEPEARRANRPPAQTVVPSIGRRRERPRRRKLEHNVNRTELLTCGDARTGSHAIFPPCTDTGPSSRDPAQKTALTLR